MITPEAYDDFKARCLRLMKIIENDRTKKLNEKVEHFLICENKARHKRANSLLGRLLKRKFVDVTEQEIQDWLDSPVSDWSSITNRETANNWYQKQYDRLKAFVAAVQNNVSSISISLIDYKLLYCDD